MGFPVNERLSEGLAYVGFANSATLTTAVATAAIDISKARKAIGVCQAGTLGASAVLTFQAQGCATSGGSYTAIPNSSQTLVKATDDNKSVILDVNAEYINSLGLGYKFIQFVMSSTVASVATISTWAGCGNEEPVASQNLASVKSILTL